MARPRGADEGQNWVWAVCALLASLALAQRSYGTAFFDALFPAGDGQHRKESLKDAAATSRFDQSVRIYLCSPAPSYATLTPRSVGLIVVPFFAPLQLHP